MSLFALGLISCVSAPPPAVEPVALPSLAAGRLDWNAHWEEAREAAAAADEWVALGAVRRTLAIHPDLDAARRMEEELAGAVARRELADAREAFEGRRRLDGAGHLSRALEARPDDEVAARLARREGLVECGGRWMFAEDAARLDAAHAARAARRRPNLGLEASARLQRTRGLRVWTAATMDPALGRRLLRLVDSAARAWRSLLLPLAPQEPRELDVVVVADPAVFRALGGPDGVEGIYLPERRVALVLAREASPVESAAERPDRLERAVLHEVGHALLHALLDGRRGPRWLEEGLALWLEGARLDPRGRVVELDGTAPPGLLESARRVAGVDRWVDLERLVGASSEDVPRPADPAIHAFYARSWALVRGLLGSGPQTRTVLLELLSRLRQGPPTAGAGGGALLDQALSAQGLDRAAIRSLVALPAQGDSAKPSGLAGDS